MALKLPAPAALPVNVIDEGVKLVSPKVPPASEPELKVTFERIGLAKFNVTTNVPVVPPVLPKKLNATAVSEMSTLPNRPEEAQLSALGPTQKENSGPAPTVVDPNDPSGLIVVPPLTEVSPLTDAPVNGDAMAEGVATARLNTSVQRPTNANEAFLICTGSKQ